jgi:hypothetical protein
VLSPTKPFNFTLTSATSEYIKEPKNNRCMDMSGNCTDQHLIDLKAKELKSHFIDNAGDLEGAQLFIIKLFAGVCRSQVGSIGIDKSTIFEGVRDWESSVISRVRVAVLSSCEHVMKCEDVL